jgi:mono/diheme cytochrome c family protein
MSENRDEHNQFGMIAFLFSMAFVFVFFVYIVAVHPGIDLKENIQDPADLAAANSVAAVDVSKVTEPWVTSADMIAHGTKLYAQNCAMCHGEKGLGDGAAGAALNPKPRNLVEGKWTQGAGAIAHFKVLTNGIDGTSMASYKHLKAVDRWALTHFIDSITNNKSNEDGAALAAFGKTAE